MNQAIKWGVFTGTIVTIWLFGGYSILTSISLNLPKVTLRTLTGLLGLVILFIGVFCGMKAAKAKISGDGFSYFVAFKSGFIVAVIVAIIVSLVSFLYVQLINPHLPDDMVKEAETSLKTSGATTEEISRKLSAVRKEFSAQAQLIAPLIVQTVAGSIFSLILAFFLKKK